MKSKLFIISSLLAITIFGGYLRWFHYSVWPRDGATFDEYAWTFLGLSILHDNTLISWSPHGMYSNWWFYQNPQGAWFRLVTPYLEHPPLFGIVAGASAMSMGIDHFNDITIEKIRLLSLFLGICSIVLIFLLSSSIYGSAIGFLSALIYSSMPTVVVGSRLVQNENFFIPLFLLLLFLTYQYTKKMNSWMLFWICIISLALPLAKIPWTAGGCAVVAILFFVKKYKQAAVVALSTMLGIGIYVGYSMIVDSVLFTKLMALQLNRYDMLYDSIFALFTIPYVTDRQFLDGWIYVGWLAMGLLLIDDIKKNYIVIFGWLSYLFVYILFIPNEPNHGWYRYPFYPFLAIAIACLIKKYFNRNYFLTFFTLIGPGLSMLQHTWFIPFGYSYVLFRSFVLASASGMLPVFFPSILVKRYASYVNYGLLVIVFCLTIWASIGYNEQ